MLVKHRKINLVNIALIVYVFSLIFFDEGNNIQRIVKLIFVAISLVYITKRGKIYIDKYIIWMIAFTMFAALSINWSISHQNVKTMIKTVLLNNICNFFLLNLMHNNENRVKIVINTIIFSSIFLGLRITVNYGPLVYVKGTRGGFNGLISANVVGMVSAIASVFSIYYMKSKNSYIYILSFIVNLAIMILSGSRKAILFFLVPVVIYYVLNSKNILDTIRKMIGAVVICILSFVAIIKVPFLYNSVGYRIETMINGFLDEGESDASTDLRMKMIEWGIEWYREKPYIGYGLNNYKNLMATKSSSYGSEGVYAHNNYIELLVDLGIIGTLIYYYIYLVALKNGVTKLKKLDKLQILMLGILIVSIINEYGNVAYCAKFNQLILVLSWITLKKVDGNLSKKIEESDNSER